MGRMPRLGLADEDPRAIGEQVVACWDAFVDLASRTDLLRPSRLPGWSGKDVCVHLGAWDGRRPMEGLLASARAGGAGPEPQPDADNAALLEAHGGASTDEVLSALVDARDAVEDFFDSGQAAELGRAPARSSLGELPLLSLVHASAYELAVHALDLLPCGAPTPPDDLLDRGLASLMDVTGALSSRSGIDITVSARAPQGGWAFTSGPDGWEVARATKDLPGPGVRGTAADLLDASAGRASLPQLLLSRRLVVSQLPAFMRLAPLVSDVPGLPGGAALRSGVAGVSKVSGLVGRLRPGR
jgi:uncharacterized protein (TIGR03083 family)